VGDSARHLNDLGALRLPLPRASEGNQANGKVLGESRPDPAGRDSSYPSIPTACDPSGRYPWGLCPRVIGGTPYRRALVFHETIDERD
jgi:hypothetical protein